MGWYLFVEMQAAPRASIESYFGRTPEAATAEIDVTEPRGTSRAAGSVREDHEHDREVSFTYSTTRIRTGRRSHPRDVVSAKSTRTLSNSRIRRLAREV